MTGDPSRMNEEADARLKAVPNRSPLLVSRATLLQLVLGCMTAAFRACRVLDTVGLVSPEALYTSGGNHAIPAPARSATFVQNT